MHEAQPLAARPRLRGRSFRPLCRLWAGTLRYSLDVQPVCSYKEPLSGVTSDYDRTQYVHHLLLQKSDATFTLLLWHEIADEDTSVTPHRQIQPPALPAILTLPPTVDSATAYTCDEAGTLRPVPGVITAGGKLSLTVSDRVMVIAFRPRP